MGHLYHGYVSHNQRVILNGLIYPTCDGVLLGKSSPEDLDSRQDSQDSPNAAFFGHFCQCSFHQGVGSSGTSLLRR